MKGKEKMKKILGYILVIVGAAIVALSFEEARKVLNFTIPGGLSDTYLMIIGLIVLVVGGLFVARRGSSSGNHKKGMEVPIYHGKEIVGYRKV